jgi:hypothetical protein
MIKKIFGVILVVIGILIILWGVWESYGIFKGEKAVPQIFKLEAQKQTAGNKTSGDQIQQQIQEIVKSQFQEIISPQDIRQILNLISWSIFAFILISAGGKIAFLGIALLRG